VRRGKLNNFGWLLVLLAGLFQIITLIFDQSVIQMEEKNRANNFDLNRNNELRFSYLQIAKRADEINFSHRKILWINEPATFNREKKEFLYYTILFDQTRLMEDVFRDDDVINEFKDKTFDQRIDDNPENFKVVNYKKYFDELIKENHYISDRININLKYNSEYWHQPDGKIREENGEKISTVTVLRRIISHNSSYINVFVVDMFSIIDEIEKNLHNINKDIYNISREKQLFLLFGFVAQLLSILSLLILFRNFLKTKRNKKSF